MSETRKQNAEGRIQKAEPHRLDLPAAGTLWFFVTVFCLPPAIVCPLAQAQELKVGYVNLAKVFDQYERTKSSDTTLEQKGKAKEAELEGRMGELKKLRQSLELLNDEARETKTREIEEKADELQRFRASTARDLGRERDRIAKDILRDIQQGVEQFAKANGFSLILDARSLLYGQEAYDVTDGVLAVLNNRAKAAH